MRDAIAPNLTVSSPTSRGQRWFCDVRHLMPILGGCQFRMCTTTGSASAAAPDAYSGRMSIPHSRASGVRCGLTSAQYSGLRSSHSGNKGGNKPHKSTRSTRSTRLNIPWSRWDATFPHSKSLPSIPCIPWLHPNPSGREGEGPQPSLMG